MHLRFRRSLRLFMIVFLGCLWLPGPARSAPPDEGAAGASAGAPPSAEALFLTGLGIVRAAGGTLVTISGNADLQFEYKVLEGRSLVIEIPGAGNKIWPATRQLDDAFVSAIEIGEQLQPRRLVHVAFALKTAERFAVRGEGGRIVVVFGTPPGTFAAANPVAAPAPIAAAGGVNRVSGLIFKRREGAFRVEVASDAPADYQVLEADDPRRITVLILNARIEPAAQKLNDVTAVNDAVLSVAASQEPSLPPAVKVVLELRQPAPFRVARDARGFFVDVMTPATPEAAPRTPTAPPPVPGAPARGADATSGEALEATAPAYRGSRITLDFIDADILEIFRLISEVSGKNLIAGDEVQGKRSVTMTDVPWDQALDLILKTHNPTLVQVPDADNVIRVTTRKRALEERTEQERQKLELLQLEAARQKQASETVEAIRRKEAEDRRLASAEAAAELQRSQGWVEKTFSISYGNPADVATRLQTFASKCDGCLFEVGANSNSIFVRDYAGNVNQMTTVYHALESPVPAVMIEARIVEVLSDYSQSLGIQWGGHFNADGQHGNPLPYEFPNTVGIDGTAQQGAGVNPGTYLVNLPAAAPVAGMGISLGHITDTVSLDLKLSAMEKLGKTKILSNPKVLVTQNEEAKINVGSQLPVPKTDAAGSRTVEWKDVGILLQVKPRTTSDNRVFMKVKIEKSARGETVRTTDGDMFSIERRGADTTVLVGDGETSVIGGIFIQTNSDTQSGVPGLSKLPLLGWLFKTKSDTDDRKELMIFLTPRIVAGR